MTFATEVGAESGEHMHVPGTHAPEPDTKVGRAIAGVERWTLIVILTVMAILPTIEIVGRLLGGRGVPGQQAYVQYLTLWITFLGALLATRSGKHLSLATGELIPEGAFRRISKIVVGSISAGVCAVLAYASFQFVKGDSARPTLLAIGIPEWWTGVIMPAAFALMSVRFLWHASDRWWGRAIALAAVVACCSLGGLEAHAERLVWPGIGVLLVGLTLGTPVFVAMAGIAMLLFFSESVPVASVPSETYRLVQSATLPVVPLLTAAGYVLAEGGASKRLVRLARALVGWIPGGMAIMVCLVCAGFTTFTGGSGVTILAVGGLMLPMLKEEGYPEGFALGLVTASGSLGLLFPPSFPVILYAVVAKAEPRELYIAGFLPSLLLVALVAGYGVVVGMKHKTPRAAFSLKELLVSAWVAKWEIAIPAIVIGAIFGGFATMVEASAVALLLAVFSQTVVFKDLHPTKDLPKVIEHASTLVGAVMILLGVAMGLSDYILTEGLADVLIEWTKTHIQSPTVFLLVMNGALLVLGSILEIFSAIVVLAPLLATICTQYGIDPLHMGIIFLANLELGFLFPPMGLNLILSSSRFGKPLPTLYRVSFPFLLIMAAGVLVITYVPALTTGFLAFVKGAPAAGG